MNRLDVRENKENRRANGQQEWQSLAHRYVL